VVVVGGSGQWSNILASLYISPPSTIDESVIQELLEGASFLTSCLVVLCKILKCENKSEKAAFVNFERCRQIKWKSSSFCGDWRARAVSAQSCKLWQQVFIRCDPIIRDHPTKSLYYCLLPPRTYRCYSLHTFCLWCIAHSFNAVPTMRLYHCCCYVINRSTNGVRVS